MAKHRWKRKTLVAPCLWTQAGSSFYSSQLRLRCRRLVPLDYWPPFNGAAPGSKLLIVAPRAGGEGGELRVLVGCSSCCGCWCWASPGALQGALLAAWLSGCWLLWWVGCSCGCRLEHRMTHWISERTRIRRITDYVCTRLVWKSPVQGVTYKQ